MSCARLRVRGFAEVGEDRDRVADVRSFCAAYGGADTEMRTGSSEIRKERGKKEPGDEAGTQASGAAVGSKRGRPPGFRVPIGV